VCPMYKQADGFNSCYGALTISMCRGSYTVNLTIKAEHNNISVVNWEKKRNRKDKI